MDRAIINADSECEEDEGRSQKGNEAILALTESMLDMSLVD